MPQVLLKRLQPQIPKVMRSWAVYDLQDGYKEYIAKYISATEKLLDWVIPGSAVAQWFLEYHADIHVEDVPRLSPKAPGRKELNAWLDASEGATEEFFDLWVATIDHHSETYMNTHPELYKLARALVDECDHLQDTASYIESQKHRY